MLLQPLFYKYTFSRVRKQLPVFMAIVISFVIFGLIAAVNRGFKYGVHEEGMNNYFVLNRESTYSPLMLTYFDIIKSIDGVGAVTHSSWFSGFVYDKKTALNVYAVDESSYLQVNDDILVDPKEKTAWLEDAQGVLVGSDLAKKFNWSVGDTIPLQSFLWRRDDGSDSWPVKIRGIYALKETHALSNKILMHYRYFDELCVQQMPKNAHIGFFSVKLEPDVDKSTVMTRIDTQFESKPVPTKTVSAREYLETNLSRLSDLGKLFSTIAAVILVTLGVVLANLIYQSTMMRKKDFSVFWSLGFPGHSLRLFAVFESMAVCVAGALAGLLVARWLSLEYSGQIKTYFPAFDITPEIIVAGTLVGGILSVVASLPALVSIGQVRATRHD